MGFTDELKKVEQSFLDGLAWVAKYLLPGLGMIIGFIPGIPAIYSTVLKLLPGLIEAAEAALGAGNGAAKKVLVLQEIKTLCDAADGILTGGAKDSFSKIHPYIDGVIDAIITQVNAPDSVVVPEGIGTVDAESLAHPIPQT